MTVLTEAVTAIAEALREYMPGHTEQDRRHAATAAFEAALPYMLRSHAEHDAHVAAVERERLLAERWQPPPSAPPPDVP